MKHWRRLAVATMVIVAGCGSSSTSGDAGADGSGVVDAGGNAQTPPMGRVALEAWLATGVYRSWHCEPTTHMARPPSPHGFNRICSNDAVAGAAIGMEAWPAGAAAVKEFYDTPTDTTPVGYAVYLKTAADSAAGANWYWYERVPLSSPVPHASNGVVADGTGGTGTPNTICVACHTAAGSDAAHTPSPGSHDFVYTPAR